MKLHILLAAALATSPAAAHDHIEVGAGDGNPNLLALAGPAYQLALYVPPGEPFSGYAPAYPGGGFASELTFSTETAELEFAYGSLARAEVTAVTGPAGGSFSFWETGATSPAWSRPAGWSAADGDRPSFAVYQDQTGYGHIHGRIFTFTRAGTYTVSFRAVDDAGLRGASPVHVVTFVAQPPPPLSLHIQNGNIVLGFQSRLNLSYDLQACENLTSANWQTIAFWWDGAATPRQLQHPVGTATQRFYRVVEYR